MRSDISFCFYAFAFMYVIVVRVYLHKFTAARIVVVAGRRRNDCLVYAVRFWQDRRYGINDVCRRAHMRGPNGDFCTGGARMAHVDYMAMFARARVFKRNPSFTLE